MVSEFEGRRPIRGASDKAGDDIRADVLTGLVAVGVGLSGVINTKAREFDREGSELVGWGLGSEEGSEKASKGVLNRGEGGFGCICLCTEPHVGQTATAVGVTSVGHSRRIVGSPDMLR